VGKDKVGKNRSRKKLQERKYGKGVRSGHGHGHTHNKFREKGSWSAEPRSVADLSRSSFSVMIDFRFPCHK
jgi:hypothetical protein